MKVDSKRAKGDLVAAVLAMEPATKAARVRNVLPAIEQKLAEGVRIADIVDTLSNAGLELTVGTLKSYLSRNRRRPAKTPRSTAESVSQAVDARIPRKAVSPDLLANSQSTASGAAQATISMGNASAELGPPGTGSDSAASDATAADPEVNEASTELLGSGSILSVHDALIAARKRVAATDYSKFARKINQGRKSK